jgi:putative methanogenesis marker protein 2
VNLKGLVKDVRAFKGIQRKGPVGGVAKVLLPMPSDDVLASYGEDAAVIKVGREILLMASDGIREDLVQKNPRWAGYCAVLVNVNDIAAMGGFPLAMVNVLSCPDEKIRGEIVLGMKEACEKFRVPMVGGHLHPDSSYSAVDVAILGKTDRSRLVLSTGASEGDSVMFAIDLDGEFTKGVPYSWDTTSRKSQEVIRRQLRTMNKVAPYLNAGKDISNPGALGSLGMMLEASGKGASVKVDSIPRPAKVNLVQWLTSYQGCGFVLSVKPGREELVKSEFAKADITAEVCGRVTKGPVLEVESGGAKETLFDFRQDTLGCAVPQNEQVSDAEASPARPGQPS